KEMPDGLYADGGYDSDATRWLLAWLGIQPHIGRRRRKHGSGLGKVRWVVERTISWLKGLRRLRIRYDRLGVIQEAWNTLAASVICFRLMHEQAAYFGTVLSEPVTGLSLTGLLRRKLPLVCPRTIMVPQAG